MHELNTSFPRWVISIKHGVKLRLTNHKACSLNFGAMVFVYPVDST